MACCDQFGRYNRCDPKLLQQNKFSDCLAQNGSWSTKVIKEIAKNSKGLLTMNTFAREMRLKIMLFFFFEFIRKRSHPWPKLPQILTSKKVLVSHQTVQVIQVHRHHLLGQVLQAMIPIAMTQIQTVAKKV